MEHLTGDMIWSFLNGDDLPEAELDRIAMHLDECDSCNERLANLAELGTAMPELVALEMPPTGFADRVMHGVLQIEEEAAAREVIELAAVQKRKKRSARFELFTRMATAAVVTGFMVLGSLQSYAQGPSAEQDESVVRKTIYAVSQTGSYVTDGTARVYSEIHYLVSIVNYKLTQ